MQIVPNHPTQSSADEMSQIILLLSISINICVWKINIFHKTTNILIKELVFSNERLNRLKLAEWEHLIRNYLSHVTTLGDCHIELLLISWSPQSTGCCKHVHKHSLHSITMYLHCQVAASNQSSGSYEAITLDNNCFKYEHDHKIYTVYDLQIGPVPRSLRLLCKLVLPLC